MSAEPAPFKAHIEILQLFLARRDSIVEKIQGLLNAQDKPALLQDRTQLSRQFEDLFFTGNALSPEQIRLRGQLQQAHWARGFRPRVMPGVPNEMFDPADMTVRAFGLWQRTRWPGRSGRIRYAHTLFNLYMVRCLTLLDMRLWDAGPDGAAARLVQAQSVLDQLWKTSPADQPVLVRDVRWLVPVAQSPTTDDLGPYFEVAQQIAALPAEDRLEIHKAGVLMAGGHLRSQLRHYNMQGQSLDDPQLVLTTRGSNALDFAMTIQNLVPLLATYEDACSNGNTNKRLELAGVICQGVSPDPELFVNRLDLLGPYSMIEYLFIADEDGLAVLTPMGARHVQLVQEYTTRIEHVSKLLLEDCTKFRPVPGTYSPYGVMFGFSSNLLEHMAMKTLQSDAVTRFGLEDVFIDAEPSAEKLAWVSSWRKLPHIKPEVLKLYDYPQQFAETLFGRVEQALRRGAAGSVERSGQLCLDSDPPQLEALPAEFVLSSDPQLVAAGRAKSCDEAALLHDRREGMFLVSYRTPGGWVAITKDVLTAVLGTGRDAKIAGLPHAAAAVLKLMCPGLVAT